MDASMNDPGF